MQKEIDENSIKFRVYFNYLISLAEHIENDDNVHNQLKSIVLTKEFNGFCHRKNKIEEDELKRISIFLRNAWLTEHQMSQHINNKSYINIANHWICIQSYYAIYLGLRALFVAKNTNTPETHTASLNEISNMIKIQPKIFPDPWKILYINKAFKKDEKPNHTSFECLNLPSTININHDISPLKKNQNFYNQFTRLLKTTRVKLIQEKYEELKKTKKPKTKLSIATDLFPTSLFNFMRRLRERSNYQDADIFFLSNINDQEALKFYKALLKITNFTLLLLEVLLYRSVSKKHYEIIFLEFKEHLNKNSSYKSAAEERYEFIKGIMNQIT